MMNRKQLLGGIAAAAALAATGGLAGAAFAQAPAAPAGGALTLAGVTMAAESTVAGQALKLNGAGVRIRIIIKAYVAGFYTKDGKVSTNEAAIKSDTHKRMRLVSLRNFSGDEFGKLFAKGIEANAGPGEFGKNISSVVRMGEVFAQAKQFVKGDVITVDFIPVTGLVIAHNGKQMGEPFPGTEFATLLFKLWFGPKPVDEEMRRALLGQTSTANTNL